MKQAGVISRVFAISAVVLICAMCSVVSYEFGVMLMLNRYMLTSFPTWVAFYYAIPFAIAICICLALHLYFKKKSK